MPRKALACLLLLTSAGFAAAPTSATPLGVDYSEWFVSAEQLATDSSGYLYVLASYALPTSGMSASSVIKLSPDGTTVLWQDMLGFQANEMAVTPSGDVFVLPALQLSNPAVSVAKLGAGGSGLAWTAPAGLSYIGQLTPVLAVDSQGRTYVAAATSYTSPNFMTTVVRFNAAGSAIDYSAQVVGTPTAIAADGSGGVVLAGISGTAGFVAQVNADGSAGYYTALAQDTYPLALALDASRSAVVYGSGLLQRLNATGAVTVSTNVAGGLPVSPNAGPGLPSSLGLDAAGNAYVIGFIQQLYPVQNNIGICFASLTATYSAGVATAAVATAPILTVVAPDGSTAQVTYVPGAAFGSNVLAVSPNSTVFVASAPTFGFTPSRQGPFPAPNFSNEIILLHLSPQSFAQTVPLACVGNAATYSTQAVAPGEMVALIGNGLGPAQGIEPRATAQSPFPVQVAGVEVTFDGTPAPLLWVQGSQINAIVPWSLTPGTNTQICFSSGGTQANCLTWPVAQTAPAVYTAADGVHAAALNRDESVNSATNPAAPGSIVSVFATGLGPISPAQADGTLVGFPLPSNVLPVGVEAYLGLGVCLPFIGCSIQSQSLTVTYAGPAPYLVAGVTQVNFQIPSPDMALSFSLSLPSNSSQSFQIYVAGQ